ncbi:hypothetical protein KLP40_19270 [Hymenobacter sp. NST-14]|uniref:hypothetical protein n=1 Tax=Hymenobacter piscis TaxID=2839984 RepID=UPI001C00BBF5|nr:hypothetical protein [Hymenobacter piscis]MBT9395316.1 hypothetical protein [Hymenobacter piscis]
MAKIKKKSRKTSIDFSGWFGLVVIVLTLGYFLRTCVQGHRITQAFERKTATIKAVGIDKKNFFGNSPVSQQFSYSYRFQLQGKWFEGNSRDPALRVGDSILVDYVVDAPEYNRPHETE